MHLLIYRLNNDSHPLEYLNDGDSNSIWISDFMDDITLEINLGDQFQVKYQIIFGLLVLVFQVPVLPLSDN